MEIKKYIIPSDIASKKFVVHRLQMILILGLIGSLVGFLGKHFWLFDLASHFRVQMTLFFIFAVMVSAFIRNTSLILLSILCLILNAVPVLMLILPPFSVPSSSGQHLRVLSCNVNSSLGNPQKVLKLIAQENPDIILLMEINQSWVLALDKLKSDYSHFKTKAREDNFGIALFTRTEGSAFEVIDHGSADLPSIKAVIPSKNGLLTIIGTHPPPPVSSKYSVWRNEQLQELAKTASEAEGPFILLGDFNITPWSPHFTDLLSESRLQNSSQGRGIFATWPVWIPFLWIPIDHFLHSDEVVVVDKRVGSAVDSDHFPVIVDLTLLPTT